VVFQAVISSGGIDIFFYYYWSILKTNLNLNDANLIKQKNKKQKQKQIPNNKPNNK
jgi:hypothetical protein